MSMPRRIIHASRALLVLGAVAVTWLSLVPNPPDAVSGSDKLAHLLTYAALGAVAGLSFPPKLTHLRVAATVVLGLAAYGALIEGVQQLAGREFDVVDMIANAAGAAAGVSLALVARRLLSGRDTDREQPR